MQHLHQLCEAVLAAAAGRLQDDRELIAPEAAEGGVRASPGGEPGCGRREDGVTGRVAEGVIDGLDVVLVGNAWVRGFRERRDDEPTRLSALEAGSTRVELRGSHVEVPRIRVSCPLSAYACKRSRRYEGLWP
ncbi:hypothetical protein GCM10009646_86910 [Streptomyces aureus]